MRRFPGDSRSTDEDLSELLWLPTHPHVAIQWAAVFTLRTAMRMLQAQILSRRALIGTGQLEPVSLDATAREVQRRVERIELIVAELRRRGEVVEWEP